MRKILLSILFLFIVFSLSAQTADSADRLFQNGNYEEALMSYKKLLRDRPQSALYNYRYARCSQELGDYKTAIEYFILAGDKYKLKYYFIAECYYQTKQMTEAIEAYQTFLDIDPNTERKDYIERQIKQAQKLQRYLQRVKEVAYIDSFDVAKDDILSIYDLSPEAGTLTKDSIFFGCKNQFANQWTYATKDDSLGIILVRQYRLLNMWGDMDTLPHRVNQTMEQNCPYWLSDGVTLYFAANNSDGLGGLDIYVTRYNTSSETFTIPENIGMPFNSAGNDYLYVLDETKGVGYWATDRYSTPDSVRIYKFESTEPLLWTAE